MHSSRKHRPRQAEKTRSEIRGGQKSCASGAKWRDGDYILKVGDFEVAFEVKYTNSDFYSLREEVLLKIIGQAHKFNRIPALEIVLGSIVFGFYPEFVADGFWLESGFDEYVELPLKLSRKVNRVCFKVNSPYKQYKFWRGGRVVV